MRRSWSVRIGLSMTCRLRSTATRGFSAGVVEQPSSANKRPTMRKTERPGIAGTGRLPTRLEERNLAGCEVIHAADDVDLLARVKLLDDRRRALQASHLPSHVLGHRVVEQVAGLRL